MHPQQKTISKHQSTKDFKKSHQKIKWKKQKNSGPPIFISKTYQILENNHYKDVVTWNQDGSNFIIIDVERFEREVLPIHFRHRNFSSFVRQLNMYDFHKIRNDNNKNIFEHKQFKKNQKQSLKNIKRKGCNGKRSRESQQNMSISDHQLIQFDIDDAPNNLEGDHQNNQNYQKNCQFSPMPSIQIIQAATPTPDKKQKMEEFMSSLPDVIQTQDEIHEKIYELINDPKYQCLNTKKDIMKLVGKIRRKMPRRESDEELEELSIEEEIIADKIIENEVPFERSINPTLAVLSTEKFLPKSVNLIGSFNFCEDAEQLFYQKMF